MPRSGGGVLTRPRLLFYIQHLLGIGHLVRGARVAAAASRQFDVTVALGGERPAGIDMGDARVVQLPPLKAGAGGFGDLVGPGGRPLDAAMRAERRDRLLGLFAETAPDVLMVEAYPFGRRAMRFELVPLLDAAAAHRPRPLVVSSIRDILQAHRLPERDAETAATVRRHVDLVLVHGDERLARLEDSFPQAATIADRIAYTGLVGPVAAPATQGETFDVVVSVGGGAVGGALIAAALAARPLSRLAEASWLVLTGPNLPSEAMPDAVPGVTLRRFVPDLPERLRRARLSISQAGYNTAADLLTAPACRVVLVPYVGDGETEQTRRAELMAAAGLAAVVAPDGLTPARLAAAIDQALDMPHCSISIDLDGAARSCDILIRRLADHRAGLASASLSG